MSNFYILSCKFQLLTLEEKYLIFRYKLFSVFYAVLESYTSNKTLPQFVDIFWIIRVRFGKYMVTKISYPQAIFCPTIGWTLLWYEDKHALVIFVRVTIDHCHVTEDLMTTRTETEVGVVFALIIRNRGTQAKNIDFIDCGVIWLIKGKFYTLFAKVRIYEGNIFRYLRISITRFAELLSLLKPTITYENTRISVPIAAEETSSNLTVLE